MISNLRDAGNRAIEAWDCTVLPVANDGMLQERMEYLRGTLVPNALGNRRAAFGASVLTDVLCGNGTEVGAGGTAKG